MLNLWVSRMGGDWSCASIVPYWLQNVTPPLNMNIIYSVGYQPFSNWIFLSLFGSQHWEGLIIMFSFYQSPFRHACHSAAILAIPPGSYLHHATCTSITYAQSSMASVSLTAHSSVLWMSINSSLQSTSTNASIVCSVRISSAFLEVHLQPHQQQYCRKLNEMTKDTYWFSSQNWF